MQCTHTDTYRFSPTFAGNVEHQKDNSVPRMKTSESYTCLCRLNEKENRQLFMGLYGRDKARGEGGAA